MPSTRRGRRFLAALLALVLLAAGLLVWWARQQRDEVRARFEREVGALDPAVHAPPVVAADDNAVRWLRRAAEALDVDDDAWPRLGELAATEILAPGQLDELAAVLGPDAPVLDLARRAFRAPGSSFGLDYGDPRTVAEPSTEEPLELLRLASWLELRGRLALARSDLDTALDAADALAAVRRALATEPLLLFQLVGLGADDRHLGLVQRILARPAPGGRELTEAELERLAAPLDPSLDEAAFFDALAVEAASLARYYDADAPAAGPAAGLLAPVDEARALSLYLALAEAARAPILDVSGHLRQATARGLAFAPAADILVPNLAEVPLRHRLRLAGRRLARLAVDTRRHAGARDAYPGESGISSAHDRVDPVAGDELRRRRLDGALELSFPGAVEVRAEMPGSPDRRYGPPLVWRLSLEDTVPACQE